jgi:hypothetical protein
MPGSYEEEQEQDPWPVRYPVEVPPREASGRFRERIPARWAGMGKVDTGELQKRLLWLLLAIEIGVAVAAACVLPLVFLKLPVREEGVVGAIVSRLGDLLGLSSQVICLVLILPLPILFLTMGLNLLWFRRIRLKSEEARDRKVKE